jgi:hypothetical protein
MLEAGGTYESPKIIPNCLHLVRHISTEEIHVSRTCCICKKLIVCLWDDAHFTVLKSNKKRTYICHFNNVTKIVVFHSKSWKVLVLKHTSPGIVKFEIINHICRLVCTDLLMPPLTLLFLIAIIQTSYQNICYILSIEQRTLQRMFNICCKLPQTFKHTFLYSRKAYTLFNYYQQTCKQVQSKTCQQSLKVPSYFS